MSAAPAPEITAFVVAWKNALTKVLTQLGAPNVAVSEATETALQPASGENTSVISANFAGGGCLKGQLRWTCEKTTAVQCAQLLASEPLDAAVEFTATHSDGFLEFLRQVAGEVAAAWKEERGLPAELVYQAEPPAVVEGQFSVTLAVAADKCKGLTFRLDLDAEFCAALSAAPPEQAKEENAATAEGDFTPSHASNLDLILDVQLEATIRFGEKEMLLQDVFGLTPGAVVELDQLVNEPAELLVAGRLVAKGEVVVVDGNFGLRVTEVVSRSQRAEMLSLE
ncbi:MAG TPA: FliM/FliN family flagellar motor switch protein [Terracidiphilus sp.]|nr:FliM/FliN family flagellar motor switch protein [Terracidiphilus sp.]